MHTKTVALPNPKLHHPANAKYCHRLNVAALSNIMLVGHTLMVCLPLRSSTASGAASSVLNTHLFADYGQTESELPL